MDSLNTLKHIFGVNILVILCLFVRMNLCQSGDELNELFGKYGFNATKGFLLNVDLPYWGQTGAEVERICGKVKGLNVSSNVQFYDKGVEDAVLFLCDENNLNDYKSYLPCFSDNNVAKVFKTCKTWKDMAIEGFNSSKSVDSNLTLCSLEDVYQTCSMSLLQSLQSCGKNSSKWFDTWWRKLNYYYHLSISCIHESDSKYGDDSDEWSIILGIILAVTACLLVVGIIVFVVFLFSRRKFSNNDEDSTHARGPRGFGQRREVPPPYALVVDAPGENAGEGDSGNMTSALRLVDRENRIIAETEARLYDGNATTTMGNGLILPPPYTGLGPPPDVFGVEARIMNISDSDKEDEMLSTETCTTRCSSINLQVGDSIPNLSVTQALPTCSREVASDASMATNQPPDRIPDATGSDHSLNTQSTTGRKCLATATVGYSKGDTISTPIKNHSLPTFDVIGPSQEC